MCSKIIKFNSIVENAFCLHRTFASSSRLLQILIVIHIVYEIAMISMNIALHEIYETDFELSTEEMYFLTSNCFSIVQIVLAVFNSEPYILFVKYLNRNNSKCSASMRYQKKIFVTQNVAISGTCLLGVMQVLFFIYFRFIHHFDVPITPYFLVFVVHVNLCMCDFRYAVQFIVLYSYMSIISDQLAFVVESVEKFDVRKENADEETHIKVIFDQRSEEPQIFGEWCVNYIDLVETSRLFNKVFGAQMTLMFTTMVFFYIIFLYSLTSLSVMGTLSPIGFGFYVSATIFLLFELVMLSRVAQQAQNNAKKLRQRLASLLVNSLEGDLFKPAKDLLRLVSTRPVHTKAFGSIPVDMTLLPTCIILFTYYTVIALQFNNVL